MRNFFYLLYLPFIVIWFNLFVERSSSEILPSIPQKKILLPEKRGWRSSVEKSRVKIGEKIETLRHERSGKVGRDTQRYVERSHPRSPAHDFIKGYNGTRRREKGGGKKETKRRKNSRVPEREEVEGPGKRREEKRRESSAMGITRRDE